MKELLQLENMSMFKPRDAGSLTREQKKEALCEIPVIKEKQLSNLKGRTCADGSTQKGKYPKEKTALPTLSNDAFFFTLLVNAHKRRNIATANFVGAYLHAFMEDLEVAKKAQQA